MTSPPHTLSLKSLLGRSLFPITALVVILGALVWGPFVSFGLAYVWWRIVARIG